MKKVALGMCLLLLCVAGSLADEYRCNDSGIMGGTCCLNEASCSGISYSIGPLPCQIQCYVQGPRPGQIVPAGSADCSPQIMCG